MTKAVAGIGNLVEQSDEARWVASLWDKFNSQRSGKVREWAELRNYIFATDTSTTSNASLPWKNSTTLPKLTQIRDNLHANYIQALFPNEWLKFDPTSKDANNLNKARLVTDYILNKTNNSDFQLEISKIIYDWIDKGNGFGRVVFENSKRLDPATGESVVDYMGPRLYRISPSDIVFNPLASSFEESFKIIRSVKTIGDIINLASSNLTYTGIDEVLKRRNGVIRGGFSRDDFDKAVAYSVDGFGSMYEYFTGDYVELLEFFGDYYDNLTGTYKQNMHVIIADRCQLIYEEPERNPLSHTPIYHVGWRERPDNLWAMGPLDNLVGMQYRIDHLENLKADAMDLAVLPPLAITGDVEAFVWGPGTKIYVGDEGGIQELGKNLNGVIVANNMIAELEAKMEMYAGAPREAMGIRSPGEKTAYEVNQLMTAAGRIFQEKIDSFQMWFLEKVLNAMLAEAIKNFNGVDIVKAIDNDIGVEVFQEITRDDLIAKGRLRPVGARHYAAQALLTQNLNNFLNSSAGQIVMPHLDSIKLSQLMEDVLGLQRYQLMRPFAAIDRQAEAQQRANFNQEELAANNAVPAV